MNRTARFTVEPWCSVAISETSCMTIEKIIAQQEDMPNARKRSRTVCIAAIVLPFKLSGFITSIEKKIQAAAESIVAAGKRSTDFFTESQIRLKSFMEQVYHTKKYHTRSTAKKMQFTTVKKTRYRAGEGMFTLFPSSVLDRKSTRLNSSHQIISY